MCFPESYEACSSIPAAMEVVPGPSRRILLIDDNIDILNSMNLMLKMSGHSVELAETGTQGLVKALEGSSQDRAMNAGTKPALIIRQRNFSVRFLPQPLRENRHPSAVRRGERENLR